MAIRHKITTCVILAAAMSALVCTGARCELRFTMAGSGVEILKAGGAEWAQAEGGDTLTAGARVRAATDSMAIIEAGTGCAVVVRGAAELEVAARPAGAPATATFAALKLTSGRIFVNTPPVKSGAAFKVDMPSAVAGALGDSEFALDAEPLGGAHVTAYRGAVAVEAEGVEVVIEQYYGTIVAPGGPPGEIVPIGPEEMGLLQNESLLAQTAVRGPSAQDKPPRQKRGHGESFYIAANDDGVSKDANATRTQDEKSGPTPSEKPAADDRTNATTATAAPGGDAPSKSAKADTTKLGTPTEVVASASASSGSGTGEKSFVDLVTEAEQTAPKRYENADLFNKEETASPMSAPTLVADAGGAPSPAASMHADGTLAPPMTPTMEGTLSTPAAETPATSGSVGGIATPATGTATSTATAATGTATSTATAPVKAPSTTTPPPSKTKSEKAAPAPDKKTEQPAKPTQPLPPSGTKPGDKKSTNEKSSAPGKSTPPKPTPPTSDTKQKPQPPPEDTPSDEDILNAAEQQLNDILNER